MVNQLYLFPHLPKTGGAALFENVQHFLPRSKCLRLNYTHQQYYFDPRTEKLSFYESEADFKQLLDSLTEREKFEIEFACGHDLPYGLHKYFPQPAKYFMFVREPVARTLSLYNYQRTQYEFLKKMKRMDESHRRLGFFNQKYFLIDGKIPSFEEWLEQSYNRDYLFYFTMTRTLRHLNYLDRSWDALFEKFFFVGLTETLNEDELFLYHEMGIRSFWANRNASFPYVKTVDKRILEKIREVNQEDLILYEKAKEANALFKRERRDIPRIVKRMEREKKLSYFREKVLPWIKFFLRPILKPLWDRIKQWRQIELRKKLRKRLKALVVYSLNTFHPFQKKTAPFPQNPKRILVCNIASFGDVILSTSILPVLKRHYPECEIGFLTSLKTADVLKEHPLVSRVHTCDHWFGNRERGLARALARHVIDFYRVAKEIRRCSYDVAIDLYPHFLLSAIPLLWRCKIPVRVGRFIEGYTNLLTHVVPESFPKEYMGRNHLNLLKEFGIETREDRPFPCYYSRKPPVQQNYIVVHMGTANSLKEWDPLKWSQVVQQLVARGETVILTGKGPREQSRCVQVSRETGCANFCDRLNWAEFAGMIQHAKLVISVDSVAVHLASAVQIPCLVLFAGISPIPVWKPPYSLCKALMQPVACSPCLQSCGCSRMSCIQEIQVEEVVRCAGSLLNATTGNTRLCTIL